MCMQTHGLHMDAGSMSCVTPMPQELLLAVKRCDPHAKSGRVDTLALMWVCTW